MKKEKTEQDESDGIKMLKIAVFFLIIISTSVAAITLGLLALIKFVFLK